MFVYSTSYCVSFNEELYLISVASDFQSERSLERLSVLLQETLVLFIVNEKGLLMTPIKRCEGFVPLFMV